jgi:LysM repeat protein
MSNARQVGLGILAALVSVAILLGSLSLAFTENAPRLSLSPSITWTPLAALFTQPGLSPTPSRTPAPTLTVTAGALALSESPFPAVTGSLTSSPTVASNPSATPTASATSTCPHPAGWIAITIHDGDTLDSLADDYHTTTNALIKYNCLDVKTLIPGARMYVPKPEPTKTSISCGPYPGWIYTYVVQPGDTLFHIADLFNVTVQQLMYANCLNTTTIHPGDHLIVPSYLPAPSRTPTPTTHPSKTPRPPTATSIPIRTPTATTPAPPPDTPTATNTPTDSPTHVPTRTPTDVPTHTPTDVPTDTPVPPTPTFTDTPVPTVAPTDTATDVPTTPPSDTPVPVSRSG